MKAAAVLLICFACLLGKCSWAASNEKFNREGDCHRIAEWSGDVFDQVKANPKVELSGVYAADPARFAFIRSWAKDGKSREDLVAYVFSRCIGTET